MTNTNLALDSLSGARLKEIARSGAGQKADDVRLKAQTDAFEAFMVKEVLDVAMKTDERARLFPKSAGDEIYRSMYHDSLSQSLSGGFGFSQMLYEFLKREA